MHPETVKPEIGRLSERMNNTASVTIAVITTLSPPLVMLDTHAILSGKRIQACPCVAHPTRRNSGGACLLACLLACLFVLFCFVCLIDRKQTAFSLSFSLAPLLSIRIVNLLPGCQGRGDPLLPR